MTRIASIDVGSNAMRIAIGEIKASRKMRILYTNREAVRLGSEVFENGAISAAMIGRALEAFWNFREQCERMNVILIKAVGTSALRDATNTTEFIETIASQTGIKVEVVTGEEESRLVQLAVCNKIHLKKKLMLVIDIGGGSTEVSLLLNGRSIFSESHNVGAVRLLKLVNQRRNPYKLLDRVVGSYVNGIRKSLKRQLLRRRIDVCVGSGGNFEALTALRESVLGKNGGKRLPLKDLDKLIKHLSGMSVRERMQTLKLRPDRADVILPAAITISQIMHCANVNEAIVPGVGLREGVLCESASLLTKRRDQVIRDEAHQCALLLGAKYAFDRRHAETVTQYAISIFDQTSKLHKLKKEDRFILEIAALLHDVGQFMGEPEHHLHSLYIIRSASWTGLDRRQVSMVACVARYHRKGLPKSDHELYRELVSDDKKSVQKLAAILRVADALDRCRGSRFRRLPLKITSKKVIIKTPKRSENEVLQWAVNKKSDLFQRVFRRTVVLLS